MIEPIRLQLNIPPSHLYANQLLFDANGKYIGFDRNEFTWTSNGKSRAIQYIIDSTADFKLGISKVIMIGDGVTDLQARPPACVFIGYGGIAIRDRVKNEADWFITDWKQLIDVLQNDTNRIELCDPQSLDRGESAIVKEVVRNEENGN